MAAEFFGEDTPDVKEFEPRIPCGEIRQKNGGFNQIFTFPIVNGNLSGNI